MLKMKKLLLSLFLLFTLITKSQVILISKFEYKFYSIDLELPVQDNYYVNIISPLNDTIKIITLSEYKGLYGYILDLTFKPTGLYNINLYNKDSLITKKSFIVTK